MVNTNELLSIAFALVANFTNVVHIPPEAVPQRREDLSKVLIGSPGSPLDVFLVHTNGYKFSIRGGVVDYYEGPDSYFSFVSARHLPKFAGSATIGSNDVIALATQIMKRLVKSGNPLDTVPPCVRYSERTNVNFYYISWPVTNSVFRDGLGAIEIDARTGTAVFVALHALEFHDSGFVQAIRNRVYTPDPRPPPRQNPAATMPKPTTNQLQVLIPKWLEFCRRLALDPGTKTNVSDVDWIETVVFTNANVLEPGDVYKIRFTNGTVFQAVNGKIFLHTSADAAFAGAWGDQSSDYWSRFAGKPTRRWEDLAQDLNRLLVQELFIPRTALDKFTPSPYARGTEGVPRCVVRWGHTESLVNSPSDLIRTALFVEFDLATGTVKMIRFDDPEWLRWQVHPKSGQGDRVTEFGNPTPL